MTVDTIVCFNSRRFKLCGEGGERLALLLFPTFRVLLNMIRTILNSHNVKVAQKPFKSLGHIFTKLKDPVSKE